jgi:hypothetical protein
MYGIICAGFLRHGRVVRIDRWVVSQFDSVGSGLFGLGLLVSSAAKAEEDQGNDRDQPDYSTNNSSCYSTSFRFGLRMT